ncbi:MAG TPA: hypothetical protein VKE40_13575 [Gemmataceae bacterium]|nr:hypothetical protein [Gemmataceae bacterium]
MRRWRRRTLVGLALLAIVSALVFLWPTAEPPGVTRTNLKRLRLGMSEAEVQALLGPPSADLTGQAPASGPGPAGQGRLLRYDGDGVGAQVEFDPDGRLARIFPYVRDSFVERLRSQLRW